MNHNWTMQTHFSRFYLWNKSFIFWFFTTNGFKLVTSSKLRWCFLLRQCERGNIPTFIFLKNLKHGIFRIFCICGIYRVKIISKKIVPTQIIIEYSIMFTERIALLFLTKNDRALSVKATSIVMSVFLNGWDLEIPLTRA